MAISYRCRDTEALANGQRVKRFANIESVARRKLRQLQIAGRLDDLRVPPGNRLEALKGPLKENTMRELEPVTPGELLREEFLIPMGISPRGVATPREGDAEEPNGSVDDRIAIRTGHRGLARSLLERLAGADAAPELRVLADLIDDQDRRLRRLEERQGGEDQDPPGGGSNDQAGE